MKSSKKKPFAPKYKQYDTSNGFGNPHRWREAFYERMTSEEAIAAIKEESPESILGVPFRATQAEIKKAFRELIQKWHPDKNPDNTIEAEAMSKKIIAAYTILSNNN